MANPDSFITEVTDEVRRDKLFSLFKRYGWIALLLVVLIVGGAALNEWRKSQARADAEAFGDSMLAALENDDSAAQAESLAALSELKDGRQLAVSALLEANARRDGGDSEAAVILLESVSVDADLPQIYRDVAALKSVIASKGIDPEARFVAVKQLVQPGNPLRLLALEQQAFAEIELGRIDNAIETLQGIIADAERTEDLRRRASQLIVALGGKLEQS